MAFELRYPDEISPTTSWLPAENPTPQHADEYWAPSIIHQMPDATKYVYQLGVFGDDLAYHFDGLADSERSSLKTFLSTAAGASFRVKDPVSGSYFTVKFKEFRLHFVPFGPSLWSVDLPLVRAT